MRRSGMIMHPELVHFQEYIRELVLDKESSEYGAAFFMMNQSRIVFRVAKTTPTKTGQFVTLWKRINDGPIQPFDFSDPIDYAIICVRSKNHAGQFIFPKKILCDQKVFSVNQKGGKRAIRVYAPWDDANSPQAAKTKKWQGAFFVDGKNIEAWYQKEMI